MGKRVGTTCYCYNESCNQKRWEELGYEGKRAYTVVSSTYIYGYEIPKCRYCGKTMTVTANLDVSKD